MGDTLGVKDGKVLGVVLGNELGSENGIVLGMVELVELPGLLLVSRLR